MTICTKRTDVGAQARFARFLRAIPFLLCVLLFLWTASAQAQTMPSSPSGTSVVWGIYDDASGEWVVWNDDFIDGPSVVWGADGDDPDAAWIDSAVWGIEGVGH